jgi:Flp pilus assembly pilin Flp
MNFLDVLGRLIRDDDGQDLVEYGLLLGTIAIAAALALTTIPNKMGTAFSTWGTNVQNIWVPSAPTP